VEFFKNIVKDVQSEVVNKSSSRPTERSVCKAFSQAYGPKLCTGTRIGLPTHSHMQTGK
jgi:hypothetical protein